MVSDVMTTREAATYLRTSVDTVKRLARSRKVPACKLGRGYRFRRDDLEGYIERKVDEWMLAESVARLDDPDAEFMSLDEVKAELGL